MNYILLPLKNWLQVNQYNIQAERKSLYNDIEKFTLFWH